MAGESKTSLRSLLAEGGRRSLGRARQVEEMVLASPQRMRALVNCLWQEQEGMVMRAANALERISRQRPELLEPYKDVLLGLLSEATQPELRWALTAMIPRLWLTAAECQRVAGLLTGFLEEKSSILKTCAMQGLYDLRKQDPALEVTELIRELSRSGTSAMRARGRMLLKRLERER